MNDSMDATNMDVHEEGDQKSFLETEITDKTCYICDSSNGQMKTLVISKTVNSETSYATKIGEIIGNSFAVILSTDDIICNECSDLLNELDDLETKARNIHTIIYENVIRKYNLDKFDNNMETSLEEFITLNRKTKRKTCEVCLMCFEYDYELKEHIRSHNIFCCRYCKHRFSSYSVLKIHLKKCESETSANLNEDNYCEKCELFFSKNAYKSHLKVHQSMQKNEENCNIENEEKDNSDNNVFDKISESMYADDKKYMNSVASVTSEYVEESSPELSAESFHRERTQRSFRKTELKVYECDICKFKTKLDTEMRIHIIMHSKDKLHCKICNVYFGKRDIYESHRRKHEKLTEAAQCNSCEKTCMDMLHLKHHRRIYHKKQFDCNTCGEKFSVYRSLTIHRRQNHPEEAALACEICNKHFSNSKVLKNHLEYVHRENSLCKFCGKEIQGGPKKLRFHELRHSKEEKQFNCELCGKTYKTETGFKFHMAQHTGQYKAFCEICGRGFMSLAVLNEHMGLHTKEQRYVCDVCGQKFCYSATYRVHRLWHDNPLPYKCKECGQKFSHTSLLAVHRRRVHTFERPYKCKHCHLSFTASSSLRRHELTHTGHRPHVCKWCEKGFIARKAWAKHLAVTHDDYSEVYKNPKSEYKMVVNPKTNKNKNLLLDPLFIDNDIKENDMQTVDDSAVSIITVHNALSDDLTKDNTENMLIYDNGTIVKFGNNEIIGTQEYDTLNKHDNLLNNQQAFDLVNIDKSNFETGQISYNIQNNLLEGSQDGKSDIIIFINKLPTEDNLQ